MSDVLPQALDAENYCLGAMLQSEKATGTCSNMLTKDCFFSEKHGIIFETMIQLFDNGKPTHAIIVEAALKEKGLYEQVGGQGYLYGLIGLAPATANVHVYATLVRDAWKKRLVLSAATKILNDIETMSAEDAVNSLDEASLAIEQKTDEKHELVVDMKDLIASKRYQMEHPESVKAGIPAPFSFLPELVGGRLYVLSGYMKDGKGLALYTPLATPTGWTTMGEVKPGDQLLDENGKPCNVTFVSKTHNIRCFEITFSDGSVLVADEEHQWLTHDNQEMASLSRRLRRGERKQTYQQPTREPQVRTTLDLFGTIQANGQANHTILATKPLDLPEVDLPIPPYTFGAWLGDGSSAAGEIVCVDEEIIDRIRDDSFAVGPARIYGDKAPMYTIGCLTNMLKGIGAFKNKHVPDIYLRGSYDQRLAFLQGLMDTDGFASKRGQCEFCSTNLSLAKGVLELVHSLGIVATLKTARATLYGKDCGPKYRVMFTTDVPVFCLQRKLDRLRPRHQATPVARRIWSIKEVTSTPTRCLGVDSGSHLFLAGKSMIPTHNSRAALQFAEAAAKAGEKVGFASAEMSKADLFDAWACQRTGIPHWKVSQPWRLDPLERRTLDEAMSEMEDWKVQVIDDETVDPAKLRRYQRAGKYDILLIDHLHRMSWKDRHHLDQGVKSITNIAREFEIPVILLAQINRSTDYSNPYPPPTMNRLKESSTIEAEASSVYFVYRERNEHNLQTSRAQFIIAANRYGKVDVETMYFDDASQSFKEMDWEPVESEVEEVKGLVKF